MLTAKRKKFALGTEICDMHYGDTQLRENYATAERMTWLSPDNATQAFIKFIEASVGNIDRGLPYRYTNKMLVIISDEPDFRGWWTAAWCYDGHRFGLMKIAHRGSDYVRIKSPHEESHA